MTLGEFKKATSHLSDDLVIVIHENGDADDRHRELRYFEGNWYNFDGDSKIGLRELTEELIEEGFYRKDVMEHGQPCIVLY